MSDGLTTLHKILPNEVSPALIEGDLKGRGVTLKTLATEDPLKTAFTRYDLAAKQAGFPRGADAFRAVQELSGAVAATGLKSKVAVRTKTAGARIHFQLTARTDDFASSRLTNDTAEMLTIGFYHIWSERGGVATSSQTDVYRVIASELTVDIVEK